MTVMTVTPSAAQPRTAADAVAAHNLCPADARLVTEVHTAIASEQAIGATHD